MNYLIDDNLTEELAHELFVQAYIFAKQNTVNRKQSEIKEMLREIKIKQKKLIKN